MTMYVHCVLQLLLMGTLFARCVDFSFKRSSVVSLILFSVLVFCSYYRNLYIIITWFLQSGKVREFYISKSGKIQWVREFES